MFVQSPCFVCTFQDTVALDWNRSLHNVVFFNMEKTVSVFSIFCFWITFFYKRVAAFQKLYMVTSSCLGLSCSER